MGRSKRPPPLLEDDAPPKKEPIDAKKVIGKKNPKTKADTVQPEARSAPQSKAQRPTPTVDVPKVQRDQSVGKATAPHGRGGRERTGGHPPAPPPVPPPTRPVQPGVRPLPDMKPTVQGERVDMKTKVLTVVCKRRVFVVHDEREGTVLIKEIGE